MRFRKLDDILCSMAPRLAPVNVEWSVTYETSSGLARIRCVDSRTDRTYEFGIPSHALPSLHTFLGDVISRNPDTFGGITTVRLE